MKATKIPTEYILSDKEMKCLKTYNERQRRQFLASKAESMGCHGINHVCNAVGVCRDTLYRGKYELETDANESFPEGRVRAVGGGRTPTLEKHPEYLDVFDKIASLYTAGLPPRRKCHLADHIHTSDNRVVQASKASECPDIPSNR